MVEIEVTEIHKSSASGFLCWPMNVLDLCQKDSDLPKAVEKLSEFVARWEAKGREQAGDALKQIEYASRKDSLTDAERLESIRVILGRVGGSRE